MGLVGSRRTGRDSVQRLGGRREGGGWPWGSGSETVRRRCCYCFSCCRVRVALHSHFTSALQCIAECAGSAARSTRELMEVPRVKEGITELGQNGGLDVPPYGRVGFGTRSALRLGIKATECPVLRGPRHGPNQISPRR